jgi:hypothetical protein
MSFMSINTSLQVRWENPGDIRREDKQPVKDDKADE